MPSKITTILAVGGVAVITANEESSLHSLIKAHDMGILVQAENQHSLNKGIEEAIVMSNTNITKNARIYAEDYLSINKIMEKFETTILV